MATVDSIITDNLAFVDSKQNDMASFINQIADAAQITFENIIEDTTAAHLPVDSQVDALNNIAGTFPDPPSILIPGYEVPELPDIAIDNIEHDLSTLEQARTELLSDLEDGGYGIDTDDETQLMDRTRDRAGKQAQAATAELERAFATRRFGIPPGTLYGPLERVRQDERMAISEANRDIFIQRSQQFFQARQFAITTAATLDRTRADILEIKFRIQEARARFTLASFASQLDKFRVQLASAIDKAQLSVTLYQARSAVVSDRVRAAAEAARVTIASYDANVRGFLGVLDHNLNRSRADLEAAKSQADVRLKAATAGTDFYAAIVSGALSAVNTVVSQSSEE